MHTKRACNQHGKNYRPHRDSNKATAKRRQVELAKTRGHSAINERNVISNQMERFTVYKILLCIACAFIGLSNLCDINIIPSIEAISIKPIDFDRLIMPCYLSGGSGYSQYSASSQASSSLAQGPIPQTGTNGYPNSGGSLSSFSTQLGRTNLAEQGRGSVSNGNGYQQTPYYGVDSGRTGRDSLSNLGQQVPLANSMDNFIALVSKIEAANPRLANNPDQFIKTLLGRFRMDNYYYDVRAKVAISEQDHRTIDILPAILNSNGFAQQQMQPQYILGTDVFPENLLDHDEKCSMYFMLSHFIDKVTPLNQPLANIPVTQLTGPLGSQRPPVLQAAGSGYPGQSANNAYTNGASGPRYPGPAPSFGSPATSNMNGFGSGISNTPDYTGSNPYGMNNLQPNNQFNQNYNNLRNTGQYSGTVASNSKYSTPFIDGQARVNRDERQALEYGVVTVANQENAALVLNRVLMGILAASSPPQTIRQLASIIYPTQSLTNTPKIDEEIDPLFAVTLADLWAISSIPKAGKVNDVRLLGDNGHWNDTMCPTSFQLERSNSIRFTTAELIGGLDGFSLGMFRRRMISMRKNIRLSELLKLYYSKTGFRPQFAEVGVCNRGTAINTQLDDLHRQAENYLRLYQLNLPVTDGEIANHIQRLSSFKDFARHVANTYAPPEVCQDSNEPYPINEQDQCETAKADVSLVLDTSPQANEPFQNLVAAKLAQRMGLSRQGNSLSLLTNQPDTTGYAGAYSFNAIVRNSTNTAQIGCALMRDTSSSYQGGQITEPTKLIEMFERSLVNLDSEYLVRQSMGGGYSSGSSPFSQNKQSSYVSSLFGTNPSYMNGPAPKTVGGSKIIIWFNYGSQARAIPYSSNPTSWTSPNNDQYQYKFYEAKKYLRENFRGASILVVSNSRDDAKQYVYDEERDIFTDIPQGSGSSSEYVPYSENAGAALSGPADQLVSKLLQRMCDIPALFQYPMCFMTPSDNVVSTGFVSPGRKQYWMMAPKTFFASKSVRMVFKVEGGRLRVCFGRMPKPDESASRNGQQYLSGGISLSIAQSSNNQNSVTSTPASTNDYYTGLNYGICKDVSPGQEIDFIVSDPCYKKSIAECEPFYYVIREISNPGEGDPNYMCKDEGCKRFDQAKFTMTHTGVVCSSALKSVEANWLLIVISIATSLCLTSEARHLNLRIFMPTFKTIPLLAFVSITLYSTVQQVQAQQTGGVYDFGQSRSGEKRGNYTPSEILAIILLVMTIIAGLAFTVSLCYYVTKRTRGLTRIEQDEY